VQKKTKISFVMSVRLPARMQQLGSHRTGFHEIWYFSIFRNFIEKIRVSEYLTQIIDILHEDLNKFFIIYRSVLLRMKNFSRKICRETQNRNFILNNVAERRTFYEIMWEKIVKTQKPQITIWRIAYRIPKATDTYFE